MTDRSRILHYVVLDFLLAFMAWQVFSIARFYITSDTCGYGSLKDFLFNVKACLMDVGMPCFILGLNAFLGHYSQPRRKTKSGDFIQVLSASVLASLIIFFVVVINDYPAHYTKFYTVFSVLFLSLFCFLLVGRRILTGQMLRQHSEGKTGINALIIGKGAEAERIRQYLGQPYNGTPFLASCFIGEDEIDRLPSMIESNGIECLVLAIDNASEKCVQSLLNRLYPYGLEIYATARTGEFAYSEVALFSLTGVPLKLLTPKGMDRGANNVKRLADIVLSSLFMVVFSPVYLWIALRILFESDGPVFYTQERLGKGGKPFNIYKFRSMKTDAEASGPMLSSPNDPRITPFGRILRRYRLDELPQMWNVLKGDMSLVGPRPERACYAAEITRRAPQYQLLYRVRPGITSLGMVKFGYAGSVDKMVERLGYDMIYLQGQSLVLDAKILVYTIKPLLQGKGM